MNTAIRLINKLQQSRLMRRTCGAVLLTIHLCIAPTLAQDSNAVATELRRAQKAGDSASILQCTDTLLIKEPQNWVLHYLRANTLADLGRTQEARAEYSYTLTKTSDGSIAQACRDALDPPANKSTHAQSSTNKVTDRISRQAASIGNASLGQGKNEQASWTQTGIDQARAVPNRAADMARQRVQIREYSVPRYTPAQIQNQHNQDVDEANMAMLNAKAKGDAQYRASQAKTSAADTAAANLSSQFNATSKNGFHLSEQGTNFYVRQYATPKSSAASSNPNPANVSVSDHANSKLGVFQSPLQAKAKSLNPAAQKALDIESAKTHNGNVYGNLVPKQKSDH